MYRISFDFRRNENGTRKCVIRDIRRLFILQMKRMAGGIIERMETDDAMSGLYHVSIWTRATSINDPVLNTLWEYVIGVLGVEAYTIIMVEETPEQERFARRFIISSHHAEDGRGWSVGDDLRDDIESVISIESVNL